ncbi:hypothetical protein A3768_0631 [Ralstonia solanacearum]|nr:hypothetical protein F504_2862 [Ralstonia pseudosolanacearum FQY_4]ANH31807.1 hypothetical protein A3768_0631 [Ralstonia solanacearum]
MRPHRFNTDAVAINIQREEAGITFFSAKAQINLVDSLSPR